MFSSIIDYVPWWVWTGLALGGGGAAIFFIPGALALVTTIYNLLPKSIRLAFSAVVAVLVAYLAGRNRGSANERDKNKDRADNAVRNRLEVENKIGKLTPSQVDHELDRKGDFRD